MINDVPEIEFPADFDDRGEYEAEQRGLLDNVKVRFSNRRIYSVCFFTPARIGVELDLIRPSGEVCFAEPGLIVVPAVTREEILRSVSFLAIQKYFDRLKPDA